MGLPITDCSTGAGSARPVVSMTMRFSGLILPVCIRSMRSASVSTSSPRTVQQRQPSESSITPSLEASTSRWSIETSPNSLMMTAVSERSGSFSNRFSNVVLPAPRKPVRIETGTAGKGLAIMNSDQKVGRGTGIGTLAASPWPAWSATTFGAFSPLPAIRPAKARFSGRLISWI
ncbi:hypothetical protein D9M72_478940 [compost metagenome]